MVELSHLSAGYDGTGILHDLNARFRPGELTVILGPNGCGKSTLLRAAVGLLPHRGTVYLQGEDAAAMTRSRRAQLTAYLPQSGPVPDMTVGQLVLHGRFPYLSYPRRYRREDLAAAEEAMQAMGIAHLSGRSLATLSGGTRQKCRIAMALAQNSPAIFMDEPTAGLDMAHRLSLLELCRSLAEEGRAMVLVLHELELALRYAHRVVVMDRGAIAAGGTPEEILATGVLERVFDLQVQTVQTPMGRRFFFERRK